MAEKQSVNKTNEIVGLIYLLIAALLAVAFYVPGVNAGPLGRLLVNWGKGLVGPVAYVFPVLFLFLSVSTFLRQTILMRRVRINHVFMLLILAASLFHAATVEYSQLIGLSADEDGKRTVFKAIEVLWKSSQNPAAYDVLKETHPGGVIGGLIATGLQRVTGRFGALAILVTASLAEAVVLGNFSIERILQGLGALLRFIFVGIASVIQTATDALYELTGAGQEPSDEETEPQEEPPFEPAPPPARPRRPVREKPAYTVEGLPPAETPPQEMPRRRDKKLPDAVSMLFEDENKPSGGPEMAAKPLQPKHHYTIEGLQTPNFILGSEPPAPAVQKAPPAPDFLLKPEREAPSPGKTEPHREAPFRARDLTDKKEPAAENQPQPPAPSGTPEPLPVKPVATPPPAPAPAQTAGDHSEEMPDLLAQAEEDKPYEFPPLTLLEPRPVINSTSNAQRIHNMADKLEATLASFGVEAKVVHITTGPSITRFELRPGPGVKISRIVNLSDDLALSLAATAVRMEAPIPGKSAIGIEIPNSETAIVGLRALLEDEDYRRRKEKLLVPLGRDIPGQSIYCDIAKMPHLMIAGATGSGKSICINTILISLLYRCSPKELKLLLIDPKVVELSIYGGIPHLLAPVVTDPKKAANTLNWAVLEMTRRYKLFAERQVRDMRGYNEDADKVGYEKLPFIVLVIDELSDLMATAANEVEEAISRLTAMARAAGIHLIIATQRPSVDVITGVIKANIPSRIAFAVSSQVDSRTILDGGGAEKLLGKGDMLYAPQSASKPTRGQGAYVSDHEVENVISFLKAQNLKSYDKKEAEAIVSAPAPGVDTGGSSAEPDEDDLLNEAVEVILDAGYASVSVLQRRLNIGYPRAGRLIDAMEMKGYVGPFEGSKPRKVLLTRTEWALRQAQQSLDEESPGSNETEEDGEDVLPF